MILCFNSICILRLYAPSLLAPPPPSLLPPELYCDVPLEDGRLVSMEWMVSVCIPFYG